MLGSATHFRCVCDLLLVPLLLFAPVLEMLDGDVEGVELGAPPRLVAAAEKQVRLADAPADPRADGARTVPRVRCPLGRRTHSDDDLG